MDFNDDNLYEEQPESKGFRIAKKIFKGMLYGLCGLVWVLIFWLIFSTREPSMYDNMYFSDATRQMAAQEENYQVWQLNVQTFMNYDASITVSNVYYAQETKELEIGVRYNKKLAKKTDADGKTYYENVSFVLDDYDGVKYAVSNVETKTIGRYVYYRICFKDVSITLPADEKETQPVYSLHLYHENTEEPLSSYRKEGVLVDDAVIVIYDKDTVCRKVDFDD